MIVSKYNLESLEKDLRSNKQMALFVGAGVNMSSTVNISWSALMNHLFNQALGFLAIEKDIPPKISKLIEEIECDTDITVENAKDKFRLIKMMNDNFSPLVKASIVKNVLKDSYISSIQSFLYARCNKKIIEEAFENHYTVEKKIEEKNECSNIATPFHTLYQVASLILLRKNIKAIVTYNYDNFLSQALNILKSSPKKYFEGEELKAIEARGNVAFADISGQTSYSEMSEDTIMIYHVHGFIPPPNYYIPQKGNNIVLSMDEFHESTRTGSCWQSSTPLHLLSHYTCLLFGLSFTDINLQRLIYYAKREGNDNKLYHFVATNERSNSQKNDYDIAEETLSNIRFSFLHDYGLTPIHDNDGYTQLYRKLREIVSNSLKG